MAFLRCSIQLFLAFALEPHRRGVDHDLVLSFFQKRQELVLGEVNPG
jgi:hypothetical protein